MVNKPEPFILQPCLFPAWNPPAILRVHFLALTLILLQVADACLTILGVSQFGLESEGNPLLRPMMAHYGHVEVLFVVKCFAIGAVFMLVKRAAEVPWIPPALGAMCCFYLLAAILPWTYLLLAPIV